MPRLTQVVVARLRAQRGAEEWVWDSDVPGFGIRLQPSGRMTYVVRYRTQCGRQRKGTLGRCCDLTPDQARALARKTFAAVAEGRDPAQERSDIRTAPTVGDLRDRYFRDHAEPFKKPRSVRLDRDTWRLHISRHVPDRLRVADVGRPEILSMMSAMRDTPAAANSALAILSKAFNLAESWGWRTAINPCRHVRKFSLRAHDRILSPEQVRTLTATVDDMEDHGEIPAPMSHLVKLLLLTGCRLREIMHARQEWVDRDRAALVLPDSKVGRRVIPLPAPALDIIAQIEPGEWLIPGRGGNAPMQSPHTMWARIRARARLPEDLRPHDLRHTYGSWGHAQGLSLRQVAGVLGHRQLSTTERYTHAFAADASRAAGVVAAAIAANMGGTAVL